MFDRHIFWVLSTVCILCISSCSDNENDELWDKMNEIDSRLTSLEERANQVNSDLVTLQGMVSAFQNNTSITNIAFLPNGEGYKIILSNGEEYTLNNGKDGHTPSINVKQDVDGLWYWTLDGEWLLVNGQKIVAVGKDGKDGVTPQLKIENGYWYLYNGIDWSNIGKATGDNGKDGRDGADAYTPIKSIEISDGFVTITLNDEDNSVILLRLANETTSTSIHDFNPANEIIPKIRNLRYAWKKYGVSSIENNLVLLHISDFHNFTANMTRLTDFLRLYSSYIDDVIHTGDLLGLDISWDYPTQFDEKWLQVIGNHDATLRTDDGYIIQPSIKSYNKLFAPYIANWNVSQPDNASEEGKCYYYKDYSQYNVRLIVLDNIVLNNSVNNHWNTEQKKWFKSVLDETLDFSNKAYGYHVIVAVHYPAFSMAKQPDNPFDSRDYGTAQCGKCVDEIPATVRAFKQKGGKFVCYLTGHCHSDMFGVGIAEENYTDQLCISIATASVTAAQPYCDMIRNIGDKTQDCFNLIGVDTNNCVLKIMRVGAEYDRYMRRKNVLCWDYCNNQMVYVD